MSLIWFIFGVLCLFCAIVSWGIKASAMWVYEEWLGQLWLTSFLLLSCYFFLKAFT